ncbi:chemotaxis protein CheX [Halochromatium salexigens]|uniref:Chemotaxis phosphatase CheX-like domain-containing protein n=1 Tax=Halochromatium salexigens TaxID=49447 RepID=A0AAJ0UHY0_HALSE|nr:hypothetical protein [Halochromatium salexigens]MBK5931841.1 hypothetical protein [Halochromatium salexigens]
MERLDDDQLDCLRELINVASGKATARIADIMGAFATMRPPLIALIDTHSFHGILRDACAPSEGCYLARQVFRGDVSGEVIFLLDNTSAANIAAYLEAQLDGDSNDNHDDVLLELSNIVTAAMMRELGAQMEAHVTLGEPDLQHFSAIPLAEAPATAHFDYVVKIETLIDFAEQHIRGRIFILTHSQCFDWIRCSLNRVLDELPH